MNGATRIVLVAMMALAVMAADGYGFNNPPPFGNHPLFGPGGTLTGPMATGPVMT